MQIHTTRPALLACRGRDKLSIDCDGRVICAGAVLGRCSASIFKGVRVRLGIGVWWNISDERWLRSSEGVGWNVVVSLNVILPLREVLTFSFAFIVPAKLIPARFKLIFTKTIRDGPSLSIRTPSTRLPSEPHPHRHNSTLHLVRPHLTHPPPSILTHLIHPYSQPQHGDNMGSRPARNPVVKVQKQLHVEQRIPPAAHKIHRLPARHDTVRRERESRDGCAIGYVSPLQTQI